jgi:type VI secretion system secreted protein Hcp
MAEDTYIKFQGIDGESMDSKHNNWIDVQSWSWGVSNHGATFSTGAGGGSSGKASHSDLNFACLYNKATPLIKSACETGKHIPSVEMEVVRTGEKHQTYLKIKLTDVMVSSLQVSGSGERPHTSVSLAYAKYEENYFHQDKAGALQGPAIAGYNIREGAKQ